MNTYESVDYGGEEMGTHFHLPDWAYDPSPPRTTPTTLFVPLAPQEVQPEEMSLPEPAHLVVAQKQPACPLCQGRRYNFEGYFHSRRVFASPPHTLLPLVERSYVLKDRLRSLLVTYVSHVDEIVVDDMPVVESQIGRWREQVEMLVGIVMEQAEAVGNERVGRLSEEVRVWTAGMAMRLWGFVRGVGAGRVETSSEMTGMRSKALVDEFRKMWEDVWVAISQDMGIS